MEIDELVIAGGSAWSEMLEEKNCFMSCNTKTDRGRHHHWHTKSDEHGVEIDKT